MRRNSMESLHDIIRNAAIEAFGVSEDAASDFAQVAASKAMDFFRLENSEGIRKSEVDYFKNLAISSLGTDGEIKFDDAETGFLKAALADGRAGFKEFIESIHADAPTRDDGLKMANRGYEKKTS